MIQEKDVRIKWPKLLNNGPIWWHKYGTKTGVVRLDLPRQRLLLGSSAASVEISHVPDGVWYFRWEVVQVTGREEVSGSRIFTTEELEAAFGLSQNSWEDGQWLIDEYGGHSARQGKYIRWLNFLNVPCPGTGHDGDPNVSIQVDDNIRKNVLLLIEDGKRSPQ